MPELSDCWAGWRDRRDRGISTSSRPNRSLKRGGTEASLFRDVIQRAGARAAKAEHADMEFAESRWALTSRLRKCFAKPQMFDERAKVLVRVQ